MEAAAPDMYEALRIIVDADEDCKKDGLPRRMPEIVRSRCDEALAKAEGKS